MLLLSVHDYHWIIHTQYYYTKCYNYEYLLLHKRNSLWTVLIQKLENSFPFSPSQTPSRQLPSSSNSLASYKVQHLCGTHQSSAHAYWHTLLHWNSTGMKKSINHPPPPPHRRGNSPLSTSCASCPCGMVLQVRMRIEIIQAIKTFYFNSIPVVGFQQIRMRIVTMRQLAKTPTHVDLRKYHQNGRKRLEINWPTKQ